MADRRADEGTHGVCFTGELDSDREVHAIMGGSAARAVGRLTRAVGTMAGAATEAAMIAAVAS